jgi:hypothetical protein
MVSVTGLPRTRLWTAIGFVVVGLASATIGCGSGVGVSIRAVNDTQRTVGILIDGESGSKTCAMAVFCQWQVKGQIRRHYVMEPDSLSQLAADPGPKWTGRVTAYDLPSCAVIGEGKFDDIGRMVVVVNESSVALDFSTRLEVDNTLEDEPFDC